MFYFENVFNLNLIRVICVASGEIAVPYPDRPTEGMLRFGVDISVSTEVGHY